MRAIMLLFLFPALLAACSAQMNEPSPNDVALDPTTPTRSVLQYTVASDPQLKEASNEAQAWCRTNYGQDAQLTDRQHSAAGDVVTFECSES